MFAVLQSTPRLPPRPPKKKVGSLSSLLKKPQNVQMTFLKTKLAGFELAT